MKPERNRQREIGFYVLILVILAATIFSMLGGKKQEELVYSDLVDLFKAEKVKSFVTRGDEIVLELRTDEKDSEGEEITETKTVELYSFSVFYQDFRELIAQQHEDKIIETYDYKEGFVVPWWVGLLPYIILIALAMWFWSSMMKQAGGGAGGFTKFSKARTRLGSEEKDKKTFADVAGCDEEKEELSEIVDFLKDPKAYTAMGARIPKGVLLVGPPGTGKTLLAKAVAGEANVQFLSISGSDFVEIIFIDEIDAVGRQRGSGLGGGNDEREQTLNQLLVELDGFSNNEGVIVMAATNRADILDQALLRPGRFDRQVYVGLPDIRGREAILKIHARGKQLAEDVDLNSIAKGTPGFAGADLENLMNEAALLAVRRHHRFITMEDVDEAILKVQMGPEKKSRKMSSRAQRLTAYHEAGHAVAGHYLTHVDPVHYITIIPRGGAGGFTLFRPDEDLENFKSRSEMFENIVMALGGRMAEKLFLDDISTGASNDIQQATNIARNMVTVYGMSEKLGPITYDSSERSIFIGRDFGTTKSYSEETAALIDEEVKRIFDEAAAKCEEILSAHRDELIAIAEYLLVHESMDVDEFNYYFEHHAFMPASAKDAKKAAADKTIERPARKISMIDGYAGENKGEEGKQSDAEPGTAPQAEKNAPSDGAEKQSEE